MGNTFCNTSPLSTHGRYVLGEYIPMLNCEKKILERDMCDKALKKCATHTCENSSQEDSPICKPCNDVICDTFDKTTSTQIIKEQYVCGNKTHCNNKLYVFNKHSCLFCSRKICNECIKSIKYVHSKSGIQLTTHYCCDLCYTNLNKDVNNKSQQLFLNSDKTIDGFKTADQYIMDVHHKLHSK